MNKQSIVLPGSQGMWGSYVSKYQPDSSKVLDNMFTAGSKNFVTDQTGMIDKRQGGVQWNRTSFSEAARDTYEAVFESGERHFLRVGGGVLSASTGTGLFDVITGSYSTFGNFEWATYQNRSYGCNGINAPQTYDIATSYGGVSYSFTTAKTKAMGAQAPVSAPTAGAPTAGGAVPLGAHTYKVTYMYYGSEESNGSTSSAVQTATGGFQTIPLTAIPIGGYGVTARNIYRDNNDGVYKLLTTLSDNTTTTYADTLAIGSTPTGIPQFNDVPPTFSKIALWLDSLFIAPSGETSTIRFSNAGEPDIFDPGNFVTCQSDDVITALYVYNGKLYVFGLHSFGSIEGNTPDTFYYRSISTLIGCVDNRSIQVRSIVSVPTLWWLSDKGLYFSNGNTVEYGSDLIQDLVNLNIAQVNYSTNKNTQTSFADFSGDTSSPGIDLNVNPGAINTINPTEVFSTTADWLGGSTVTNIKTSNGNFAEVPTKFAPTAASGILSGSTQVVGSNIQLSVFSGNSGETMSFSTLALIPTGTLYRMKAYSIIPSRNSTLDSLSMWKDAPGTLLVWSNSFGNPGTVLFSQSVGGSGIATVSPGIFMSANTTYWVGISYSAGGHALPGGGYLSGESLGFSRVSTDGANWSSSSFSNLPLVPCTPGSYTFAPVASSGQWTSPIYDSGSASAVSASLTQSGSYPSGTSGTTTVYASNSPTMSGSVNQVISSPNGTTALTLTNYRYWQIVSTLNSSDDTVTPSLGSPSELFDVNGLWISQPIDTTLDNVGWGTLTYTGNIPLGTSATLTIATSSNNITYSSFGPISGAGVNRWAKVQLALATDSGNTVSPAIASVTLNWNVTSTIESTPINTGTIPAGFSTIQWEQTNLSVGSVTFYLRTATTSIGLSSASYVVVANGDFPNLSSLQFVQWKLILSSAPNSTPEITSVTVNWYISSGTAGVRCASTFYNKTYYLSVATLGSTSNDTLIQLDQFGNWRIQKDASIGTFLSYFNTLYFTDGVNGNIFNGFIANTDNGAAIEMDVRTKAWNAENDLFLKLPRAFKITGLHTGTTLHAFYSNDRGATWVEMLNESGVPGYTTNTSGSAFTVLFVPDANTLVSSRTLMYRLVSADVFPCSIINYVPSFYSRKGRYLNNG